MKKFIYSMAAIAAIFGMTACSSEEDVPSGTVTTADTYYELTIGFPKTVAVSRGTNEWSDGKVDVGIDRESTVKTVSLYFFNTDGTFAYENLSVPVNKIANTNDKTGASNEYGVAYTTGTMAMAKKSDGKTNVLNADQTYRVYVLCNQQKATETEVGTAFSAANLSESDFKTKTIDATIDVDATNKNLMKLINNDEYGMPMSSRGYYQNDIAAADANAATGEGYISANFSYTKQNNINNPVKLRMYLERAYGRVTMDAASDDSFTFNLYDKYVEGKTPNVVGTVTFIGYRLINKTNKYNLFRQVFDGGTGTKYFGELEDTNVTTDNTDGKLFLNTPLFATFSAAYSKATANANLTNPYSYGNYNVKFTKFDASKLEGETGSKYQILDYAAENAMLAANQTKGYTTGIQFMARIKKTGQTDYTDLYGYDGALYTKLSEIPGLGLDDEKNASNYNEYGVTKYPYGYCYYTYYIRHIDNGNYPNRTANDLNQDLMGDMEFAIVRSNSYKLTISQVFLTTHTNPYPPKDPTVPEDNQPNPPTPPTDPDDPDDNPPYDPVDPGIDPGTDTEDEFNYMNATFVVRPWIVRGQTTIFVE